MVRYGSDVPWTRKKHYWLTPPELYAKLDSEFHFDFDPCPHPRPEGFDGLTCEWGQSNYANPPYGKGWTKWVHKALLEASKGKRVVLIYPIDKWLLEVLAAIGADANIRNLGNVRFLSMEDGTPGHVHRPIAAFIIGEPHP